jgi:hypothetical protein
VLCETFEEACKRGGYIRRDEEWEIALEEASKYVTAPHALTKLFACIIVGNDPSNTKELWEKFGNLMTLEFLSKEQRGSQDPAVYRNAENKRLMFIHKILMESNRDLWKLLKMEPLDPFVDITDEDNLFLENVNVQASLTEYQRMEGLLNDDQKNVMHAIEDAFDNNHPNPHLGKCFFVDGPGGTGKTFLYNCVSHFLMSRGKPVCNMAWSGIAATLLINGRTVHSVFGLPLHCEKQAFACAISPDSVLGRTLANYDAFIIDEVSMVPRHALDAIDGLLRELHPSNRSLPFGGVSVLLGGDFRQISPVVRGGDAGDQIALTVRNCPSWKFCRKFRLTLNMRVRQQNTVEGQARVKNHTDWLLRVGNGEENKDYQTPVPPHLECRGNSIADFVYPPGFDFMNSELLAERAILCPKNSTSLEMNNEILKRVPGDSYSYLSVDDIEDKDENPNLELMYPTEWLNEQTPSGLPPHCLTLKVGAIVMLLRNLHIQGGLCNGTRMIVQEMHENSIQCKLIIGPRKGDLIVISRQDLLSDPENGLPVKLRRRQFPLRLAFLMTINKSQGQSLERVGVLLRTPCFAHGQCYVAVSRCTSPEGLAILVHDENSNRIHSMTNVVIPQILYL